MFRDAYLDEVYDLCQNKTKDAKLYKTDLNPEFYYKDDCNRTDLGPVKFWFGNCSIEIILMIKLQL